MPKKERRKTSDIMQIIRSKGDHDTVRPIEIGLQTHQWPPCSLNPTKPEVESGRRLNGLVVRGRACGQQNWIQGHLTLSACLYFLLCNS